ncbi:MAG: hypothetical protein HY864_00785 [Chloroflexi bacterium]|nr:hypothetical protein [Chloroflexota bacterium]
MQDSQLLLRDGSADMTATLTGSYVLVPKAENLILRIVVPTFAETGDKIVFAFTYSDDGTNAKEVVTLPDVTYAKVVTSKITEYFTPLLEGARYVKVTATVTDADAGADFNAGKVLIGIVPAGRYNNQSNVLG